jgi:outer membrane protein assembly factor BamE
MSTSIKKLWLILFCLLLSGCSLFHMYRFNIQQGNVITPDMLAQLKPGLTQEQVSYLMGTPVLVSTFDPDRWDYVYTYQPGGGKATEQHITLYFTHGVLQRINNPAP